MLVIILTAPTVFGNWVFSKYPDAISSQSLVVGSDISIGCNMSHITSHVSSTIFDMVDTPIRNSKCNAEKCVPQAKYLNIIISYENY